MDEVRTISPSLLRRFVPLAALLAALSLFLALGGQRHLTFAALAQNRAWLEVMVARAGPASILAYVAVYAAVTSLSVPGATILTLAGGLLFGAAAGGLAALCGATMGASVVFLVARTSIGALIERHAGPRVAAIEAGFRALAASYLLVLRLVPLFPFWLVNLVSGLFGMRLSTFVLFSFVGMAPGTLVYASLGAGLGDIIAQGRAPNLMLIFAPRILLPILALAALALLPVFTRWRNRE